MWREGRGSREKAAKCTAYMSENMGRQDRGILEGTYSGVDR